MHTLAELDRTTAITVAPDDSAETALERLLDEDVTELFVVDADRHLLGIVPDYELLKARLNGTWQDTTARQVMSHRVLCFTAETTVAEALRSFREGQHSRAALIEDGRLSGQITRTTLLRSLSGSPAVKPLASIAAPKFLQSAHASRGFADSMCS